MCLEPRALLLLSVLVPEVSATPTTTYGGKDDTAKLRPQRRSAPGEDVSAVCKEAALEERWNSGTSGRRCRQGTARRQHLGVCAEAWKSPHGCSGETRGRIAGVWGQMVPASEVTCKVCFGVQWEAMSDLNRLRCDICTLLGPFQLLS